MNKPHGIIVFGANGSGKTTLGRELARILDFKHMDIEDYHFEKSKTPYTVERTSEDCLNLMLADIMKYRSFVLTAVTGDLSKIEKWAETLTCPVSHVDGTEDWRINAMNITKQYNQKKRAITNE